MRAFIDPWDCALAQTPAAASAQQPTRRLPPVCSHSAVLQDKLREIGKPKTVGDSPASDLALGRMLGGKKILFCETKPISILESTKYLLPRAKKAAN